MITLVFALWMLQTNESLIQTPLNEFTETTITSATTKDGVTFFHSASFSQGLVESHWFFCHNNQRLFLVKDGRIPNSGAQIAAIGNQYLIISFRTGRMAILGSDFLFKESADIRSYFKFPADLEGQIRYISPYLQNTLLLTIRNEDLFKLALYTPGQPLQVVSEQAVESGDSVLWAHGDALYMIQGHVAKITEILPNFRTGKVILPAQERVESRFSAQARSYGINQNSTLINRVIPQPKGVSFLYSDYYDDQGKKITNPVKHYKVIQNNKIVTPDDERLVVGQSESHILLYEHEERSLVYEARP